MTRADEHLPRDARRQRTEAAILLAAQELFAESGFERATIRGVAARAGVDPALVMQYFHSKEQLFGVAARWSSSDQRIKDADAGTLAEAALADMFGHFEDEQARDSAIALMRNCLTHPSAAAVMRDEVLCDRTATVAAKLDGADAELRAALIGACMMGLGMARYLMEVEPVAQASREDIERVFAPALRALADPQA